MHKHENRLPSAWVTRFTPLIPRSGRILDLACGSGRHLRQLADRDQPLVGVDVDLSGVNDISRNPGLELHQLDLEQPDTQLPHASYAGIIVTNSLYRPLLDSLANYLAADGILIYETFALGNEQFGRPRNPDFLLQPNELLNIFSTRLQIIGFEQGYTANPAPAIVQRMCAINSLDPQPLANH